MTPEDEPPRSQRIQYAARAEWRATADSSRKNEVAGPSGNDIQLWMCLGVKVKTEAVKNNTA